MAGNYFSKQVTARLVLHVIYFEPLVNSSTIQDFHFLRFSRIKLISAGLSRA